MDPVRIGLLGCGSWGPQFVNAVSSVIQAELVAVADLKRERAETVAGANPGIRILNDPDQLFKAPDVDAVLVVTPTPTHREMACMALAAGKHVLVEKPVAPTLEEARLMVDTAEGAQRVLMVGQIMRFMPAVGEVRRRIRSGDIGRPLHVVESRYGTFRAHAWPDWWTHMDGFLLLHLGSHSVDAILWELGLQANWAFAEGISRRVNPSHGAIDAFALTLGLEDEVLVGIHHEATGGSPGLAYHLLAVGEEGRLEMDEFTTVRLNGAEVFRQQGEPYQPALKAEISEFCMAIQQNRPASVSGKDVLGTVACLDAARLSLHSGRKEPVRLHLELG